MKKSLQTVSKRNEEFGRLGGKNKSETGLERRMNSF